MNEKFERSALIFLDDVNATQDFVGKSNQSFGKLLKAMVYALLAIADALYNLNRNVR